MRVAVHTPLPPARSGIAHYSSMLLPALGQHVELVDSGEDVNVYQLGNNLHHEAMYRRALEVPGVAVLHDLVLHHLIVEITLARGDAAGYVDALRANHGQAGAAWAVGRVNGLHSEMGNFLMPASIQVAQRSRAVIVHNRYAAERLRSFGVTTPIHVVPHPYEPATYPPRDVIRARLGIDRAARVIGLFGFLTSAKRSEVVLEAFARARAADSRLQLLVVGEPAPNIDAAGLAADGVTFTGYVADEDFRDYYAAVDRLVNLRYPTAGETSGTLIRAFDAGKPVAVSDYAQFAELPDACVTKVPFGDGEVSALSEFFLRDLDEVAITRAQRDWLEANARMELTVAGYLAAMSSGGQAIPPVSIGQTRLSVLQNRLPLFPSLQLVGASSTSIEVANSGDATVPTRTYGQPAYRLIAKVFDGSQQLYDRWLELPRDLGVGERASIDVHLPHGRLELHHALDGVATIAQEAWAHADV